jgi:hypothetical protein
MKIYNEWLYRAYKYNTRNVIIQYLVINKGFYIGLIRNFILNTGLCLGLNMPLPLKQVFSSTLD